MLAAKTLINWLDRNPSSLVSDYDEFRENLLKYSLQLSSILVGKINCALLNSREWLQRKVTTHVL